MATIKSFTDVYQSKKLAEILSLETSDMMYTMVNGYHTPFVRVEKVNELNGDDICAWSLVALLDVLPNGIVMNKDSQNGRYHFSSKYIGTYVTADNPIDACVEVIEKLHEQNLL